jgi:hypothetical protein
MLIVMNLDLYRGGFPSMTKIVPDNGTSLKETLGKFLVEYFEEELTQEQIFSSYKDDTEEGSDSFGLIGEESSWVIIRVVT